MSDRSERGCALFEKFHPGLRTALDARRDPLLPGMADAVVGFACGWRHARPGLPFRSRYIAGSIWRMGRQGGFPAANNGLTMALRMSGAEDEA